MTRQQKAIIKAINEANDKSADIVKKALELEPQMKILDVGGGVRTFVHATDVIDLVDESELARHGWIGTGEPRFERWTKHDICETPWPFEDNEFDFIWCTQTLEDIRDPIAVCKEMMRVGRGGYINVPGKAAELTRDMMDSPISDRYNGYCHHRWLVDIEDETVVFSQKGALETTVHWFNDNIFEWLEEYPELCVFELMWAGSFKVKEQDVPNNSEEMFNQTQNFIKKIEEKYHKEE